jgi:DNA-binding transcriptional MocR family regulator
MFPPVDDRSARGLAAAVARAIRTGDLAIGERLPPVRTIARDIGISPTTVSEAWQELIRTGAIETRGRNGTFVREPDPILAPRRYRQVTDARAGFDLDLSTGTPDPSLLPPIGAALARAAERGDLTTSYADDPVLPELGEVLRERWPFAPDALTVVDGAMDALDRVLRESVRIGDRVVVEDPTFPPLLDLLGVLGAEVVGVAIDSEGVLPRDLRDAVAAARPTIVVLQPRAQNPTGASFTPERGERLAAALADADVLVVEDDHSGDIAIAPPVSIGAWLPERTIRIHGFSKSHGPDLRIAAVGGAAGPIDRLATRRQLGPGWSSRLLQATLADLVTDDASRACVQRAGLAYAERQAAFASACRDHGMTIDFVADGINTWLRVADEQHALVSLASRGIGVAPGTPFRLTNVAPHLRVTIAGLTHDFDRVASAVAGVARAPAGVRRA